jgi:hypothetical protein
MHSNCTAATLKNVWYEYWYETYKHAKYHTVINLISQP